MTKEDSLMQINLQNLGIKTEQNTSFFAAKDMKYAYIQLILHPETKYYKLQCVRYIRL